MNMAVLSKYIYQTNHFRSYFRNLPITFTLAYKRDVTKKMRIRFPCAEEFYNKLRITGINTIFA